MLPKSQSSGSGSAPRESGRRVGLTHYGEVRLKARLRKRSPSEPWVEAQFVTVNDVDAAGRRFYHRYHDPRLFPPGGRETLMVRCRVCGIFNPPNAMEHGVCLDHADHTGWPSSHSAAAIQKLVLYNVALENQVQLEPEDARSLHEEIRLFKRKCAKTVQRAKARKQRRKNK